MKKLLANLWLRRAEERNWKLLIMNQFRKVTPKVKRDIALALADNLDTDTRIIERIYGR